MGTGQVLPLCYKITVKEKPIYKGGGQAQLYIVNLFFFFFFSFFFLNLFHCFVSEHSSLSFHEM